MKIGAKVKLFNWAVVNRRAELGITQKELAEMANVPIEVIGMIEGLRSPHGKVRLDRFEMYLNAVASALDLYFDDLFPQEYLDALQADLLPRRTVPLIFCREISLDQLTRRDLPAITGPDPAEEVVDFRTLYAHLDRLNDTERRVIELRYGFSGQDHTLQECGQLIGVTIERIRQIEAKALRKLRYQAHTKLYDLL
jgi:RNA polymerase sigma factor (sigma-70 family)